MITMIVSAIIADSPRVQVPGGPLVGVSAVSMR
jgi:hypothetical protein